MIKKIITVFSVFTLVFSYLFVSASANSAQTWWKGRDASGIVIRDDSSPVIVKNEVLTFNIDSFPEPYYRSREEMEKYSATVTAQYTLYNPSDYDITVRLLFPFGEKPMYFYENYNENTGEYEVFDDTEKHEILLNGNVIEKNLRHTLSFRNFNLERDLEKISDSFIKDSFYYPEMSVKEYSFTASSIDTEKYNAANAAFDIDPGDTKTRYLFPEGSGLQTQLDGTIRLSNWVKNGDVFTVYVLGDTDVPFPEWTFYKNGGVEDREKIDGIMTLKSVNEMTLYDLVFADYDKNSGISETDWYNAVIELMNETKNFLGSRMSLNVKNDLLRWYEYEIEIPAKSEVINTVNAPIYPEIDSNYSPAVYTYIYLLSPAKTWADFKHIDIIVNTPHFMVDGELLDYSSDIFTFTEVDGGYKVSFDRLPEEELVFTLSNTEHPVKPQKHITDYLPIELIISFSVITATLLIIILIIIFIRKRIIKTKKEQNR